MTICEAPESMKETSEGGNFVNRLELNFEHALAEILMVIVDGMIVSLPQTQDIILRVYETIGNRELYENVATDGV